MNMTTTNYEKLDGPIRHFFKMQQLIKHKKLRNLHSNKYRLR